MAAGHEQRGRGGGGDGGGGCEALLAEVDLLVPFAPALTSSGSGSATRRCFVLPPVADCALTTRLEMS